MISMTLKEKIETRLKIYIEHFVRYATYANLTPEKTQIIAGTFAYLENEHDMVPDDIPNIGYLDDLLVFVEVAQYFLENDMPVAGLAESSKIAEDLRFIKEHEGLMFVSSEFSIDVIKMLGKKHAHNLKQLSQSIKEKYSHFGGFNYEQ